MTTADDRDYLPAMGHGGPLAFYDAFSRLLGGREAQWPLVAQAGIEPGSRVLEIGCGTGSVLLLALRAVPDAAVTGLDPDPHALALATRKLRRAGSVARLDRGFADRLPYPDGGFDRVLSSFMLHHLPAADEQDGALREARRVLAPGGRLHLVDFTGNPDGPVGRLLHRRRGHGHAHGQLNFGRTTDALAAAGFTDVREVAHGRNHVGSYRYFRATR